MSNGERVAQPTQITMQQVLYITPSRSFTHLLIHVPVDDNPTPLHVAQL